MTSPIGFFRRLTLRPQGITIILAGFLPIFAIVSMFPAVPALIDHFANDPTARWKVPMIVSAPGLSVALLAPLAGILVDRFGRRKLALFATALYGFAGVAPLLLTSLNQIFVSRLLVGVSEAIIITITNTLIGDYWRDKGRRDWLFLQGAIGPFCSTGMMLVVGSLVGTRWNAVFLVYLIAFPILLAMVAFIFEPARGGETATARTDDPVAPTAFPWASAALIAGVTLASSIVYYVFIINGGLLWREVGVTSAEAISRISALPTLFIIAGSFLFRLLGRQPNEVQVGMPLLVLGLGLGCMGLAPDWRVMTLGLIIQQTGAGMMVQSLIAWASGKLPFQHRGRGMGIWSSAFFLGQFASPAVVHQMNLLAGTMQGAFVAMGLMSIVAACVAAIHLLTRRSTPTFLQSEQSA